MTGRQRCEKLLVKLQEIYPKLNLTFGYLGNCGPGFGDIKDDYRNWYFFTNCGCSFKHEKFGGFPTKRLDVFADFAEERLHDWCSGIQPATDYVYDVSEANARLRFGMDPYGDDPDGY